MSEVYALNAGGRRLGPREWQPNGPLSWHPIDARTAGRPWTEDEPIPGGGKRITVKRCCNGCGAALGDVQDHDISSSGHLTDVRSECPICTPPAGKGLARCLG